MFGSKKTASEYHARLTPVQKYKYLANAAWLAGSVGHGNPSKADAVAALQSLHMIAYLFFSSEPAAGGSNEVDMRSVVAQLNKLASLAESAGGSVSELYDLSKF